MLFQKQDATSSEESKTQSWTNCLQTNPLSLELTAGLGLDFTENQLPLLKTKTYNKWTSQINHYYKEFLGIRLIQASCRTVNWYGNKH